MSSEKANSGNATPPFAPGSSAEAFRNRLQSFCATMGFSLCEGYRYGSPQLIIEFSPNFPMWVRIDVDSDAGIAVLAGVVRTYGLAGDRSDYHDLISLLWAAELRSYNEASVRLIDIPHPVCPGEL